MLKFMPQVLFVSLAKFLYLEQSFIIEEQELLGFSSGLKAGKAKRVPKEAETMTAEHLFGQ